MKKAKKQGTTKNAFSQVLKGTPVLVKPTVHALVDDKHALCGFSNKVLPRNWPTKNYWVKAYEAKFKEKVNCKQCRSRNTKKTN